MWRKMCRHWWTRQWKNKWRTRLYSWSRSHIPECPRISMVSNWLAPWVSTSSLLDWLAIGSFRSVSCLSVACCWINLDCSNSCSLTPCNAWLLSAVCCCRKSNICFCLCSIPSITAADALFTSLILVIWSWRDPCFCSIICIRPIMFSISPESFTTVSPSWSTGCVSWISASRSKSVNCAIRMPFLAKLTILSSVRLVFETTSAMLNFPSNPLRAMSVSASWSLMLDTEVNCDLGSRFKLTPPNFLLFVAILTKSPSLDQCKHQKVDHSFAYWPLSHTKWFVPKAKFKFPHSRPHPRVIGLTDEYTRQSLS